MGSWYSVHNFVFKFIWKTRVLNTPDNVLETTMSECHQSFHFGTAARSSPSNTTSPVAGADPGWLSAPIAVVFRCYCVDTTHHKPLKITHSLIACTQSHPVIKNLKWMMCCSHFRSSQFTHADIAYYRVLTIPRLTAIRWNCVHSEFRVSWPASC